MMAHPVSAARSSTLPHCVLVRHMVDWMKQQRMVRHNQLCALLHRLLQNILKGVQRHQHPVHRRLQMAALQAHMVPLLFHGFRRQFKQEF